MYENTTTFLSTDYGGRFQETTIQGQNYEITHRWPRQLIDVTSLNKDFEVEFLNKRQKSEPS